MRRFTKILLVFGMLLPVGFTTGCAGATAPAIEVSDNTIFIDARSASAYQQSRIQGAYNIDFESPNVENTLSGLNRSRQYILYGDSGSLLQKAYDTMLAEGFIDVILLGSMDTASRATGVPIE